MSEPFVFTVEQGKRLLGVVDKGLSSGLGKRRPGYMCVEAAVCYALGLPHGDDPPCVATAARFFKIALNDNYGWSNKAARAKGMRKLAVAQVGSAGVVGSKEFALGVLNRVTALPKEDVERGGWEHMVSYGGLVYYPWTIEAFRISPYPGHNEDNWWASRVERLALADVKGRQGDAELTLLADIALEVLRDLGSPGVQVLDALLAEEAAA
jgi:hypothetical protein